MIMKSQGLDKDLTADTPALFVAAIGETADIAAQKLVFDLRNAGIRAQRDLCERSVKAQMKYANKLGAKFSMVLGEDEINNHQAEIKNMETGETSTVTLTTEAIRSVLES